MDKNTEKTNMKALLAGFIFLVLTAILMSAGYLLFPLLIIFVFFLRIIFAAVFILCAVWLLGKIIIYVLEKLK